MQRHMQQPPDLNSISAESKFAFSTDLLSTLHNPDKNVTAFYTFGGLPGIEKGIRTDRCCGLRADETILDGFRHFDNSPWTVSAHSGRKYLSGEELAKKISLPKNSHRHSNAAFADRKAVFLDNHIPSKKTPSFVQIAWMNYNDPILFLLTAAAAVSLAIGLYQTFATTHTAGSPPVEWVEGVAILVAVCVIVLAGTINDFEKERQFKKLYSKQLERETKVIRSGRSQVIPVSDVFVGDVVHLEPGTVIPADGILIDGHNISCDESSVTGEPDLVHKHKADDLFQAISTTLDPQGPLISRVDPFIISGTTVLEGIGTFLVTATGINSTYGKLLSSVQEKPEATPLQTRLTVLAKYIARSGGVLALLLFVSLFIKFLATLPQNTSTKTQKGQNFIDIVVISLTVLVIVVPEGLPLAVTLSLAFASNRMLKDHNLVRHLRACETMGNATNICSDKTGTLTQNNMAVVAGTIGTCLCFQDKPDPACALEKNSVSFKQISQILSTDVRQTIKQSITLNSTAFEGENGRSYVGSNTESALLAFARDHLGMGPVNAERSNDRIAQMIPFLAARQCMATIIQLPGPERKFRVFIKGASEVLLAKCTRIVQDPTHGLADREMDDRHREFLTGKIEQYARLSLRTISLVFRDIEIPPLGEGEPLSDKTEFSLNYLLQDLVFLCCVGLEDPLRPGVSDAVQSCRRAGVTVRMVTGDNIQTAKAIAEQCGILSHDGNDLAMEGAQFRALSELEMNQVVLRLKVLARSSPVDKQTLVVKLREMGETVAVTGDGTNDAPALSAADIGFSMGGISGTDVARQASSIILLNDDFTSIVKAILWGRAVNNSVRKFLAFQITVTITSVLLTFVSALAIAAEQSVLTPVQLMWINLFQDTLAALALATDHPVPRLLDQRPEPRSAPLINTPMWKMIVGQSIYQLTVTLVLLFAGNAILSLHTNDFENPQLKTLVFNTYVWMQIFNMYNNRQHDNTKNIFEGVLRNWLFMTISAIMIGGQVLIVFVGGQAFSVVSLTGVQWAIALMLGLLSLLVGVFIRLIPDAPLERMWTALVVQGRHIVCWRRSLS